MLECTNMTIFMCVSMRLHECIKYSCLCVCVCVCVCVFVYIVSVCGCLSTRMFLS